MPTDMDKAYGGYSTFRPQRNAEGDDECIGTEKCQCPKCIEKRKLMARWFPKSKVESP